MGIGPSTKETTLHHFRDPILNIVSNDNDIDLMGIMIVGTPQDNEDKNFVGTRAAAWAEAMRVDGIIISVDGWGNSHLDYANTIEEIAIGNDHVAVGMKNHITEYLTARGMKLLISAQIQVNAVTILYTAKKLPKLLSAVNVNLASLFAEQG